MRVTVVPEDRFIQVDGVSAVFDFECDPNIHAIQWNGNSGIIEWKTGGSESTSDRVLVEGFVSQFNAFVEKEFFTKPKGPLEKRSALVSDVDSFLNSKARSFGYDSIVSAISYADEPAVERYQTEGRAFRAWRSLVWEKVEQVMEDVKKKKRKLPTTEELISELPLLTISE